MDHQHTQILRRCRRVTGLQPLLPDTPNKPAQRVAPLITLQHPQEPRDFSGESGEDVDDWQPRYERVSRYNRWHVTMQLANVLFFLTRTVLVWFENNEETVTSWARFVTEIRQRFGGSAAKRKKRNRPHYKKLNSRGKHARHALNACCSSARS